MEVDVPLSEELVANIIAHTAEPVILAHFLPGLDETLVRNIEKNSQDNLIFAQRIASAWFHNKKETPTWDKLIGALKERIVAEATLAQEVECLRRGSNTSTGSTLSNSLTSWNGSELTNSGNGGSVFINHSAQLERLQEAAETTNLLQIKRSFTQMTNSIADELECLDVSVGDVKKHISSLIDNGKRFLKSTSRCRKIKDLFMYISGMRTKIPVWSYDNHGRITQLIKMVATDEENRKNMLKIVKTYNKKLNGYMAMKQLASVIPYCSDTGSIESESEDDDEEVDCFDNNLMRKLKCYLGIKITSESLEYINELWKDIKDQFCIPSLTAFIYSLVPGSLIITWLIQPSWACCILSGILKSVSFFQEHLIGKVVLDNVCIYDENNEEIVATSTFSSLWLKQASLSGRVERFQKVLDQPEIDINTVLSKNNATPLMIASYHGHDKLVSFLLENGASSSVTLDNGQTALHLAAIEGFSDVVGILHSNNNELLGVYDQRGYSPLMEAAARNHCEVVQVLVDAQLDDSQLLPTLDEAFFIAIKNKHTEIVERLLKSQFKPFIIDCTDAQDNGLTPLMKAVCARHPELVSTIAEAGAELDLTNNDGKTALMLAAESGQRGITEILLKKGAEINLQHEITGKTAQDMASENGHLEVVEVFAKPEYKIKHVTKSESHSTKLSKSEQPSEIEAVKVEEKPGIASVEVPGDGTAKQTKQPGKVSQFFEQIPKLISKAFKKKTVSDKLLAACRSKSPNIDKIKEYLEHEDCDVNIREADAFKWNSLMWCCERKHFEIGRLLLKHHPEVNILDKKEWSPLVLASRAGDLEIVQGIVELGAEIDKPTNRLWTPLMWAAHEGHASVAEFLLKKGAQVDFPDVNVYTPLMQASQEGHVDVVNVLLRYNAHPNHQTNNSWSALMEAARSRHSEVVDALLKGGAEAELPRDDGSTALHVASYYRGNSDVVNALIKHGANVNHSNKDGLTPLMLATTRGNSNIAHTLIEGGADIDKPHPETEWTAIFFAAKSGNLAIFKELLYKGAKTEIEGTKVVDVASLFKKKAIVSELKKFEESPHRQISSHAPTLEPSPPTVPEVEPEIPKVPTPQTTKPPQDSADTTSSIEAVSATTAVEVKPEEVTTVQGPVTTETQETPEMSALEPQAQGIKSQEQELVSEMPEKGTVKATEKTPEIVIKGPVSEKETKPKTDTKSKAEEVSTINTPREVKVRQYSDVKADIKRKADIIDLLLRGFDHRMTGKSVNEGEFTNNQHGRPGKGVQSAGLITHRDAPSPVVPRPIQSHYVKVEPDDDLFS